MSLRRRLILVVVLAAVALGAAALAIFHVLGSSDTARRHAVEARLDASTGALADSFAGLGVASLDKVDGRSLDDLSRAVAAPLFDAEVGFCNKRGEIVSEAESIEGDDPDARPRPPTTVTDHQSRALPIRGRFIRCPPTRETRSARSVDRSPAMTRSRGSSATPAT